MDIKILVALEIDGAPQICKSFTIGSEKDLEDVFDQIIPVRDWGVRFKGTEYKPSSIWEARTERDAIYAFLDDAGIPDDEMDFAAWEAVPIPTEEPC